ncbi:HAD-IA family hydrolase [Galbitalea sp. SE-J8]|uniref:HAD-IA family hydrolase n=1 Tax=Galbitalea sp. SE-J8 TaxID=3054952 RepID=UPI00259D087B|nr:HAD-IA family hydrolase [Galbitalea sp. SE-J8]MDM4763447.1 HAD-IA family hydrolase [Galbitalea sp. SE-J8]
MTLYLFDFDKTLYAYDFRRRLPELARVAGVSEYRLASRWWARGLELRAEAGEFPTADEYLDAFARETGSTRLTLAQWARARQLASHPNAGVVAELTAARDGGATVSLLSNNPSVFEAALPIIAPDVTGILAGNVLVSAGIGIRKPAPHAFEIALDRYGAEAAETFFVDDSADNVAGARSIGITAHHYTGDDDALHAAIAAFQGARV